MKRHVFLCGLAAMMTISASVAAEERIETATPINLLSAFGEFLGW